MPRRTTTPSERLTLLVATHPSFSIDRHTHDISFASCGRWSRTTDRGTRNRRSTYPASTFPAPFPPVGNATSSPSPSCGDTRSRGIGRSSSRDESHAKSTHRPCVHAPSGPRKKPRKTAGTGTGVNRRAFRFEGPSIIAIRLHRQRARPPSPPIRRAESPRDRPDCPTAQSFRSLHQVARLSSIASPGKLAPVAKFSCYFTSVNATF